MLCIILYSAYSIKADFTFVVKVWLHFVFQDLVAMLHHVRYLQLFYGRYQYMCERDYFDMF